MQNINNTSQNKKSLNEKLVEHFQKKMWIYCLVIFIAAFIQIVFCFIILFHRHEAAGLTTISYITWILMLTFSIVLLYPTYIYANKVFINNMILLSLQLIFIIFIIPITLYLSAEIQIHRISDTQEQVTVYLKHSLFVYTQAAIWMTFLTSGGSVICGLLMFYFAKSLTNKPWKLRRENEKVISKPKN